MPFAFTNTDCRDSILDCSWIILISLLFRSHLATAGSVLLLGSGLAYYSERVVRSGLKSKVSSWDCDFKIGGLLLEKQSDNPSLKKS